jgi:uroporphyrin-III C-methyltransferase
MGVATAGEIADKLMADGVSPAIPVAVLENGTRADMRTLRTLLADLGDMVVRENVVSPALIVVGDVAIHALAQDVLASWTATGENISEMRS